MSFPDILLIVITGFAMIFGAWFGHAGWRAWLVRLPLVLVVLNAATGGYSQRLGGICALAFIVFMSTVMRNASPKPIATGVIGRVIMALICQAMFAGAPALPSFLPAATVR